MLQGLHTCQRAEKAGELPHRVASGQEAAVGAVVGSSSLEGHWGRREGLRGQANTGMLKAGGRGGPSQGVYPREWSAVETVKETEASTIPANGHPLDQEAEPTGQPRGSSGDSSSRLSARLRAAMAHSPDPQTPRARTWGHSGCGPGSVAGF